MSYLRRTGAGSYNEEDSVTIEQVQEAADRGCIEKLLRPVDSIFSEYPKMSISGRDVSICRNGGTFSVTDISDGRYRVYDDNDAFLMVGQCENGIMKTVKSFFEV